MQRETASSMLLRGLLVGFRYNFDLSIDPRLINGDRRLDRRDRLRGHAIRRIRNKIKGERSVTRLLFPKLELWFRPSSRTGRAFGLDGKTLWGGFQDTNGYFFDRVNRLRLAVCRSRLFRFGSHTIRQTKDG